MTFYEHRAMICNLLEEHASRILELLDAEVPHNRQYPKFRAALAVTDEVRTSCIFLRVGKPRKRNA